MGAGVFVSRAGAGMCARRRSNFLLSRQEKVTKEKTTPSLRPPFALSGERGQSAMLGPGVVPQNSLRSSNSAQTAAASQITKCVCPSAHAPTPGPALLGAARRGAERGQRRLLLRSCALGRGRARCALPTVGARSLCPGQAQRGSWGRAKQWPVWSPLPPPSDRAEKRRAWGERVPKDTRLVIWLAEAETVRNFVFRA